MNTNQKNVRELMNKNRRQHEGLTFTLPSIELYPFQWQWDSCFHAFIYNFLGEVELAKAELEAVCARVLPNGLLPHIIYWDKPKPNSNWGRENRGDTITSAWGTEGSSSITQPPIIARAVYETYIATKDKEFLKQLYPILKKHFLYLAENRNYKDTQLLYIINPDESGEDNAPRYDKILSLPYKHSANDHLEKRIELMRANTKCLFKTHSCMSSYFAVVDVGFNSIYYEGLEYMSCIAKELNEKNDKRMFERCAKKVAKNMHAYLCFDNLFLSIDVNTGEKISVLTWNIFMPLYAGILSQEEAQELVQNYLNKEELFNAPFGIRTTAKTEPSYDPEEGFWRGPVWMAPHWFIYQGLKKYGFHAEAAEIVRKSLAAIEKSGFREQYHPETGEGQGATGFTWAGLSLLIS